MKFFSKTPNFDFVGKRIYAMVFSLLLFIASIVSLSMNWLNLGLDFRGGVGIEIAYTQRVEPQDIRSILASNGYKDAVITAVGDTGRELSIRISEQDNVTNAQVSSDVIKILETKGGKEFNVKRRELVGAKVGQELREDGGIAMLIALTGILLYVMMRFEWRFSLGAVIALIHDVVITLGFFSLFQINFDLTVLAALLAVIGYSLNDTIVVYDRIRENFRKIRKGSTVQITNTSLNQTLSRTTITSMTTLVVLIAMFFFGGDDIKPFSIALIVGIVVGTYSSIFVASSMVLALKIDRSHLMPATRDTKEDGNP